MPRISVADKTGTCSRNSLNNTQNICVPKVKECLKNWGITLIILRSGALTLKVNTMTLVVRGANPGGELNAPGGQGS